VTAPDPGKLLSVLEPAARFVRQLQLTSQRGVTTGGKQKYLVKKNGKVTMVTSGSAEPVRHGVERATATISFLDIGQPQSIKAPASSVPVLSRG